VPGPIDRWVWRPGDMRRRDGDRASPLGPDGRAGLGSRRRPARPAEHRPLQVTDLVAKPGRLLVVFQGDRQLELLLETFERPGGATLPDSSPPVEEEIRLAALRRPLLLVLSEEELWDPPDPIVYLLHGPGVVVLREPLEGHCPGAHHRDVGPILVEFHLVAL